MEIRTHPVPFDCDGLMQFLDALAGPRLAIVNTPIAIGGGVGCADEGVVPRRIARFHGSRSGR